MDWATPRRDRTPRQHSQTDAPEPSTTGVPCSRNVIHGVFAPDIIGCREHAHIYYLNPAVEKEKRSALIGDSEMHPRNCIRIARVRLPARFGETRVVLTKSV